MWCCALKKSMERDKLSTHKRNVGWRTQVLEWQAEEQHRQKCQGRMAKVRAEDYDGGLHSIW